MMKKENKYFTISIVLMFLSAMCLFLAITYYDITNKIKNNPYSDKEEYDNVTEGLDFLSRLPIHFNIINQYFSNFNHLSQEKKEEIVMAYVIKNQYNLYDCGSNYKSRHDLCVSKDVLNSAELLSKFGLKFSFKSDLISIYVDGYGTYLVESNSHLNYYKIVLDESKNHAYQLYSVFERYRQTGDVYVFYLYQGYYSANCEEDSQISLFDFMTGESVYTSKCNSNHYFLVDPLKKVSKLQLYKYELKKDKNDRFYLYGYNPVRE